MFLSVFFRNLCFCHVFRLLNPKKKKRKEFSRLLVLLLTICAPLEGYRKKVITVKRHEI